jgi:hypothetical protein
MTWPRSVQLAAITIALSVPWAARGEFGTQTSLGYSDNIDRVEVGGRSDRILTAVIGGEAGQPYGELERHARWQAGAIQYLDDTFGDEGIATLDAAADFALIERRLLWRMDDQLGLQSLSVLGASTPDTREQVNYFTTGPALVLPISDAVAFSSQLSLADVWYEEQPLGNTRTGLQAGFEFGLGPRRSLGIFASQDEYRFDETLIYSDYERRQVFLQFDTRRRRGTLRTAIGTSALHGLGEPQDGAMIEIDWQRTVSSYGTFGVLVQRGFSDAGEAFQFNQTLGGGAATSRYIAGVSNPMERSHIAAQFGYSKARTTAAASYYWTREDYVGLDNALNRDIPFLEASVSRELSPRMRFDARGTYGEQDSIDTDTKDRERRVSLGLTWDVGRRANLNVELARFERQSTIAGASYQENRAFVTFGYGAELARMQAGL